MSDAAEIEAGAAALDEAGPWPRPDENVQAFTERASEAMLAAVEPLIRARLARDVQAGCPAHITRDYTPVDAAYDNAARIVRGDA